MRRSTLAFAPPRLNRGPRRRPSRGPSARDGRQQAPARPRRPGHPPASANPAVLIFENLAERTLAYAQLAKRANASAGYEPLLDQELRPILADCLRHRIAIVSNFGAANPRGAAAHILRLAAELGLPRPRVAIVQGDDLSDEAGQALLRPLLPPEHAAREFVSANVYQGAFEIAQALQAGAQV